MPFKFAPGTRRKFTLMRDAMLAGTSHNPYTSSTHVLLLSAKVGINKETTKYLCFFYAVYNSAYSFLASKQGNICGLTKTSFFFWGQLVSVVSVVSVFFEYPNCPLSLFL